MANFIPNFHFTPPKGKLTNEWAMKIVNYYFYNTRNFSLLDDKNVREIEEYASGEFDLRPFKKMFKSEDKKMRALANPNNVMELERTAIGVDYSCYPLIPEKLNSAVAIIQKIPIEISCVAVDPLAI